MKKQLARFYPLIVFVLALVLYANTIPNSYNLDDELVTINHRNTSKGFKGIKDIFTEYYYEDDMGYKYAYRPVTHLSFAFEHAIFGESPHVSHAINVLLYGTLCLLIYYLLAALDPVRGPTFAFFTALLFAVHPIHTEVVASIKNRDEILSLGFALLALGAVFRMKNVSGALKQIALVLLALAAFVASVFSKPSSVTLVVLLPLAYIFLVNQRWSFVPFLFASVSAGISGILLLERIEVTAFIVALSILFVFISLLFNKANRDTFIQLILRFIDSIYFDVCVFVLATSLLILSYLLQNTVYFVPFFTIAGIHLSRLLSKKWVHVFMFLYAFNFLATAYFYGNFDFIWGYSLFYIFWVEEKKKKHIIYTVILLLVYTAVPLYAGDWHGIAAILMVSAYLSPWRKQLVQAILFSLTVISFFDPVLFALYLLIFLLALLYFGWIKLKKVRDFFNSIKPTRLAQMSAIFMVSAIFFQGMWNYFYNDMRDLASIEISELIGDTDELVEINPEIAIVRDIDRPLIYVENPIVEHWDWNHRVGVALSTMSFYVAKMAIPYPLSFYYGFDTRPIVGVLSWQSILGAILGLAFLVSMVWLREDKLVVLALMITLLGLAVYSNFLSPVAGIVGERLAFHASLGFVILLSALIIKVISKEKLRLGVLALIIVPSFAFSMYRNHLWKDGLTLFSHDIKHLNNSAQANALLGTRYLKLLEESTDLQTKEESIVLSETHFERAVEIYPDFINWWLSLGEIYIYQEKAEKAKFAFERVLELDSTMYPAYNYLLDIAVFENDKNCIVKYSEKLAARNPQDVRYLFDLSAWYYEWDEQQKVIEMNDRVLAINPSIPEGYLNKAYAYAAMEEWNSFRREMEYAAGIAPDHPDYLFLKGKYEEWLD